MFGKDDGAGVWWIFWKCPQPKCHACKKQEAVNIPLNTLNFGEYFENARKPNSILVKHTDTYRKHAYQENTKHA